MIEPNRGTSEYQRRSTLLNEVGRRLLTRTDGKNRKIAEHLEQALRRALDDAEKLPASDDSGRASSSDSNADSNLNRR
jgi:hypothetical protein